MSKRETSELLVAELIARLAENGVVTEDVSAKEMFGEALSNEKIEQFSQLVDWLEAEGVVRLNGPALLGVGYGPIYSLVLTSKGFRQLEAQFKGGLTLGEAVKQIAETKSFNTPIGDFIGGILGGFTKSVSS